MKQQREIFFYFNRIKITKERYLILKKKNIGKTLLKFVLVKDKKIKKSDFTVQILRTIPSRKEI